MLLRHLRKSLYSYDDFEGRVIVPFPLWRVDERSDLPRRLDSPDLAGLQTRHR